jgi:hypothetical protein
MKIIGTFILTRILVVKDACLTLSPPERKLTVSTVENGIMLKWFLREMLCECGLDFRFRIRAKDNLFCGCSNELLG